MLKIDKRVLSLPEALCSVLNGTFVPDLYEVEVVAAAPRTSWETGARTVQYKLKNNSQKKTDLPSATSISVKSHTKKPSEVEFESWIKDRLQNNRGVIASIPGSTPVAFCSDAAFGNSHYWVSNLLSESEMFNKSKTHYSCYNNKLVFEANMLGLEDAFPPFIPEGDAFGLEPADTDVFLDAGITVSICKNPYDCQDEPIRFKDMSKRLSLCSRELAYTIDMASKGVAPCVIAAFFTHECDGDKTRTNLGSFPMSTVPLHVEGDRPADVSSIVIVTQISTFSLYDLMNSIISAPVESDRNHKVGVLESACGSIFSTIRKLTTASDGHSITKLNMNPQSIVFCPDLVASEDEKWTLKGTEYMPVSEDYLDGVPKIFDFNSVFTKRVPQYCFNMETSFVMHSMLMVAFTKAHFGAFVSSILWKHLLSEEDPSGFVRDAKSMQSNPANAFAFLEDLASTDITLETPELFEAVTELVRDMEDCITTGVLVGDGSLSMPQERSMFTKLISLVSGSSLPDTRLFERNVEPDEVEQLHLRALEAVKQSSVLRQASKAGA